MSPACIITCLFFSLFLAALGILSSLYVFPEYLGVGGQRGSIIYESLIFLIAFAYNNIAVFQVRDADSDLYKEYSAYTKVMVIMLLAYGLLNLTFGYSDLVSSMFLAFSFGVGIVCTVFETGFKKSILKTRKNQVIRYQELRELNKFLKKKINELDAMELGETILSPQLMSERHAYKEVYAQSKKEFAYLDNVLK